VVSDAIFYVVLTVLVLGGIYLKGHFDGAESVRRQNRTLNESRRNK
jgi:hypothetical protein